MSQTPLYIVDIIGEVVSATDSVLFPTLGAHIDYLFGRPTQILTELQKMSGAASTKGLRYPLIALFMDFPEQSGGSDYYTQVKFPKISIATITDFNDSPKKRYPKTFKTTLYPIYMEFMRQLTLHRNVVGNDTNLFSRIKWDRPGTQPEGGNLNDYLDAIELQNLQLTFKTVNPQCSKRIKINSQ
jgi:hypothetical protein